MTTLTQVALACPVCATEFRSHAVVSTNSFGGKRTDFHERAAGTQPLPYLVHTCGTCGYSGAQRDFAPATVDAPEVWRQMGDAPMGEASTGGTAMDEAMPITLDAYTQAALRACCTSVLADIDRAKAPLTGSVKYELAARCAEVRGDEQRHVADLWLRAAWCAVDEGDVEADRFYRLKAARGFMAALESPFDSGIRDGEHEVLLYLTGELWRRIGDPKQARHWFDQGIAAVQALVGEDRHTKSWVGDVCRQQRDCPREWFG